MLFKKNKKAALFQKLNRKPGRFKCKHFFLNSDFAEGGPLQVEW